MSQDPSSFRTTLKELGREAGVIEPSHPTAEVLGAYHAGRLSPSQEAELRRHLAGCHECVALLLDLESLSKGLAPGVELSDADVTARWTRFQARLSRDREEPRLKAPRSGESFHRRPWLIQKAYPIAATLAALTLGTGLWNANQRLYQPVLNPEYEDGWGQARDPSARVLSVAFRPGVRLYAVVLHPDTHVLDLDETYTLDIVDALGREVWRSGPLRPDPVAYTFTAFFPYRLTPIGEYRIRVFAAGATEQEAPIDEFRLRIEPEPPADEAAE